jgi:hypothetical protein
MTRAVRPDRFQQFFDENPEIGAVMAEAGETSDP